MSTSLDINIAKKFGKIYGKGFKGIEKLSFYTSEKEVLLCAYSKFKITKINGNYYFHGSILIYFFNQTKYLKNFYYEL